MESSVATDIILPLILAFMMAGMGLSLTIDDFKRVLIYPKAVAVGIAGQLILLPLIGFAAASVFPLSPEMAVGIMLLAACPGGVVSNVLSHLARGNTALSVTLTAISSTATLITIPLLVNFALSRFLGADDSVELPIGRSMMTLFLITLVPVALGMLVRARAPGFADRQERLVRILSGVFMALLVVGLMIAERDILADAFREAGPSSLALNVAAMLTGYLSARLFRLDEAQRTSITIEIGVQNSGLAIVIATTLLSMPAVAIPPAIYSLVMYATSGAVIFQRNRGGGKRAAAKTA